MSPILMPLLGLFLGEIHAGSRRNALKTNARRINSTSDDNNEGESFLQKSFNTESSSTKPRRIAIN